MTIPQAVARATFALYYEDLFIGSAFAIAPLVAITAAHHIRLNLDDCGNLNLRRIGRGDDEDDDSDDDEEKTALKLNQLAQKEQQKLQQEQQQQQQGGNNRSASKGRSTKTTAVRRQRATDLKDVPVEELERIKKIVAVTSYVQKDNSCDVMVLWLDRPVPYHQLRAHHPPEGTRVMMVSAAISEPHSDFVTSAGRVTRSAPPDATTVLCRAAGLVSARGYSGSVVIELPEGKSVPSVTAEPGGTPFVLEPRVLGLHVSIYQQDGVPNAPNLVEFVSSLRILRMMCMYNVDPFSSYSQGRLLQALNARKKKKRKRLT